MIKISSRKRKKVEVVSFLSLLSASQNQDVCCDCNVGTKKHHIQSNTRQRSWGLFFWVVIDRELRIYTAGRLRALGYGINKGNSEFSSKNSFDFYSFWIIFQKRA